MAAALAARARGARPLAGGTRLLAEDAVLDEVLDLSALGWDELVAEGPGLRLGATLRLEELAHAPLAAERSAGLLNEAARAHSASPLLRGMASVGGEAVAAAHDSPLCAALVALEARALLVGASGERAVGLDEAGTAGDLVRALRIPEAPSGAALERLAVLPSAPALVGVAAALWLDGDRVARARIAALGLAGPPARVREAEAALEGRPFTVDAASEAGRALAAAARFREDAHASAAWRARASGPLARRALVEAAARAGSGAPARGVRPWMPAPQAARPCEPVLASVLLDVELNGRRVRQVVGAGTTLMAFLRGVGMHGVKHGCETGECGACAVLVDGRPVASCLGLAVAADGRSLETVEGLGEPARLHPVQRAFVDTGAVQCGYCTPAMALCARALLETQPQPAEAEVRDALSGCLCRCTGYVKPVEAVLRAAADPT